MNRTVLCSGLSLLTALSACAPKATTGGGSRSSANAVNYNAYNDDLTAARPSYAVVTSAPSSSVSPPTRKADVVVAPKPATAAEPVRPNNSPPEILYVNKRLDNLLDTIAFKNRSVRYAAGYRIQIYVGNEREEADAAKLQVYQAFPELTPYLSYKQPTYRLKVGDFMRRLDAEWYLSQLKPQFRAVMLQPDKVDIRRSLIIK